MHCPESYDQIDSDFSQVSPRRQWLILGVSTWTTWRKSSIPISRKSPCALHSSQFPATLDMRTIVASAISRFSDPHKPSGSHSICHYVVKDNRVFRNCYGQHVGFKVWETNSKTKSDELRREPAKGIRGENARSDIELLSFLPLLSFLLWLLLLL